SRGSSPSWAPPPGARPRPSLAGLVCFTHRNTPEPPPHRAKHPVRHPADVRHPLRADAGLTPSDQPRRSPVTVDSPPVERPSHVVVIGAGMAGLATAHALGRHADRVTVIERDSLPSRPAARAGTPQGRHLHILQPGGLLALERLLPGFSDELIARGATAIAAPGEILWMSAAGWVQPQPGERRGLL